MKNSPLAKMFATPLRLMLMTIVLLSSNLRAERSWTEFRGPTGQGHSQAVSLPVHWTSQDQVRWKTEIPGHGWSSPVVQDGQVFLTAAVPVPDSDDLSLQLIIVDGGTGEVQRQVEVFRQVSANAASIHSKNSHASPTPLIDEDRLYVHFGHQGTACYRTDGQLLWKNDSLHYEPQHGNGGSPIVAGDKLIFSCDGAKDPFVVGLNKYTGEVAWKKPRVTDAEKTFSFSTPLLIDVNGQTQVISPGSNCVAALDPDSGDEIWRVNYRGYSVVPRPVYGHGLVYISTGFDSPITMAIRPDGHGDVTDTHVAWAVKRGAPNTPSLLLVGDRLYMVSDNGVASCLDPETGKVIWQQRLGGNYSASPLYADGRIYFQSEEGQTVVVADGPEFQELARNDLGERTLASFGVLNNDLLIRTETQLYCIAP